MQAETPLEGEPVDSDPPDFSSLSGDDIDAQLAALDRLVDETENEVGILGRPGVMNWVMFHAETGDFDVEIKRLDAPSPRQSRSPSD